MLDNLYYSDKYSVIYVNIFTTVTLCKNKKNRGRWLVAFKAEEHGFKLQLAPLNFSKFICEVELLPATSFA